MDWLAGERGENEAMTEGFMGCESEEIRSRSRHYVWRCWVVKELRDREYFFEISLAENYPTSLNAAPPFAALDARVRLKQRDIATYRDI